MRYVVHSIAKRRRTPEQLLAGEILVDQQSITENSFHDETETLNHVTKDTAPSTFSSFLKVQEGKPCTMGCTMNAKFENMYGRFSITEWEFSTKARIFRKKTIRHCNDSPLSSLLYYRDTLFKNALN